MALPLHIPPCIHTPAHPFHPPPIDKPLRVSIEGALTAVEKLLPGVVWHLDDVRLINDYYPQPAGSALAKLTYRAIYGRDPESAEDLVIRDELLRPVGDREPLTCDLKIDYYGITFDHLVPADEKDPEVLQININDVEADGGAEANQHLLFSVDPAEYVGKKVLAVPRCCQKREGTTDWVRVNDGVDQRDTGEWPGERRMMRAKQMRREARQAQEKDELKKNELGKEEVEKVKLVE